MKITVLGRYGKFPNKDGSTCSYLIESELAKIVVDMGSGALRNLNKILSYEKIDGVVLSHLHGDHCADAYVFRNIAFEYTRNGVWDTQIPFFMPKTPKDDFNALKSCVGFDVQTIEDKKTIKIKDLGIEFFAMNHPIETYGMKITDGKKTLVYTADTAMCENLPILLKNCDMALVDASILQKHHKENMPHISVKQIAEMTKNIDRTLLTHLEYGFEKEILDEAKKENKKVELAVECKTIEI